MDETISKAKKGPAALKTITLMVLSQKTLLSTMKALVMSRLEYDIGMLTLSTTQRT